MSIAERRVPRSTLSYWEQKAVDKECPRSETGNLNLGVLAIYWIRPQPLRLRGGISANGQRVCEVFRRKILAQDA